MYAGDYYAALIVPEEFTADFVSLLDIYRTGDVNNKKYLAALFDTFLVRVDLYDDHFKITFDPTGGKMPVDIPIGAEDSPESPGDSPESSDFEASPQDAEKFVLALHDRTKILERMFGDFLF